MKNAILGLLVVFTFLGCASPKKNSNFVPYAGFEDGKVRTSPEKVKLLREQFPKGLTLKNNLLEVEPGYEKKIFIIGRVNVELQQGFSITRPTFEGPYFHDPEKATFLNNYCSYNLLNVLPFPILNYFNPLVWPCFFESNHVSNDPEDIQYREKILEASIRKLAADKGANMVVGYTIGGINIVMAGTATPIANMSTWSAAGYAIRYELY